MLTLLKLLEAMLVAYKYWRFDIVHESRDFLIVNKPPDVRINSNDKSHETVETFLRWRRPQLANSRLHHNFYFVHRLDYATSGILCIPLNKTACKAASSAFQLRKTKKYYVAVVRGVLARETIVVDEPVGDHIIETANQKMCPASDKHCANPRSAVTLFLVLGVGFYENYPCTKVLIRPITGRRHQIRVHCSHLGHTIVGDYTYSNKKDVKPSRMYLHSHRLILPTGIEDIDTRADDKFQNWTEIKTYNKLADSAYNLLDQLAANAFHLTQ